MNTRAPRLTRRAWPWLVACVALAAAGAAGAAEAAGAGEAADTERAAGAVGATGPPAPPGGGSPSGYQDRLIDGGNLAPDVSSGDLVAGSDASGAARSIRIDALASGLSQSGANAAPEVHENGVVADAQWDTRNWGAWSADGALRLSGDAGIIGPRDSRGSFVIHQRAMPFDDGWQADNTLGDLNSPLIGLARAQPRFVLPGSGMLGVTTEWRGPSGLQLVAGAGEPGIYSGIKVPTFTTLGGSVVSAGAQYQPAAHWIVGGEYAAAQNANIYYQPLDAAAGPGQAANSRIDSSTALLSAAWQDGGNRAQMNLIDGTLNHGGNAVGVWLDGVHARGALTQSFGAFRVDPGLAWGNQLIASDLQGGYYRADYQTRRWSADFGVDEVLSVSGHGVDSTFVNGGLRRQLLRDTGVGAIANLLLAHDGSHNSAWSLQGYADQADALGTVRLQAGYASSAQTHDASVTVQQDWSLRTGWRLSSAAGLDRISGEDIPGQPQQGATIVRLAAYGGADLSARLSLVGSVQWAQAIAGRAAPNTNADVTLNYQASRNWAVLFSYYENRTGSWTPLVVNSPINPPLATPQASQGQRGWFLTVRYQDARGGHFVPLGGTAGSGSGRLSGVIYLDANENGRYDAGETGAANVTVVVDGRFSVRTDASGRFDFPAVIAGHHVITVQSDNLPLPWALADSGRTEVEVQTRDRTEVAIGARRIK
ncbi:MAG: hypothetical protein JSR67_07020 [Proteobacteria bacterium]|nr:hypothetical protein [Pseudomonadota bacterium]